MLVPDSLLLFHSRHLHASSLQHCDAFNVRSAGEHVKGDDGSDIIFLLEILDVLAKGSRVAGDIDDLPDGRRKDCIDHGLIHAGSWRVSEKHIHILPGKHILHSFGCILA